MGYYIEAGFILCALNDTAAGSLVNKKEIVIIGCGRASVATESATLLPSLK